MVRAMQELQCVPRQYCGPGTCERKCGPLLWRCRPARTTSRGGLTCVPSSLLKPGPSMVHCLLWEFGVGSESVDRIIQSLSTSQIKFLYINLYYVYIFMCICIYIHINLYVHILYKYIYTHTINLWFKQLLLFNSSGRETEILYLLVYSSNACNS